MIDQALLLFGPPEKVTADIRVERDGALTDDAFDLLLHYPPGLTAALHSSMLVAAPRPRYVLHGSGGSFVKHGIDPQEALLRAGERPTGDAWGLEATEYWGRLTLSNGKFVTSRTVPTMRGDYRCFYENLRDALFGKASLAVSCSQALNVMRVLELAQRSSVRRTTLSWAEVCNSRA